MKQKTETLLCISFMELLRKYPFPKITIQKIAKQCGVNRQTFYYHFDNIYDLMAKSFEYELINESRIYEEKSWEAAMHRFLQWMQDNKIIIKNILANVETHYFRQAIYPVILRCMDNEYQLNTIMTVEKSNESFCDTFKSDVYRNDVYKNDVCKSDVCRNDVYKNGVYKNDICKQDVYKNDAYKNDIYKKSEGDMDEEFVRRFLTLGITQYILEWADSDFKEPASDMIEHMFWLLKKIYS